MTTVTLHAGTVTLSGANVVDPKVLAGAAATAWTDGSDASYATVWTSYDSAISAGAFQDAAEAPLDQLSVPVGATVSGITFNFRVNAAGSSPQSGIIPYVALRTSTAADFLNITGPTGPPWIITGGPTSYAHAVTSYDLTTTGGGATLAGIFSHLQATGNLLHFATFSRGDYPTAYHYGITVYEASVTVDYTAASSGGALPAATRIRRAAPLVQHPRDDGRGTSTAPLNFPSSKAYQSSNRNGGGYR